MLNTSQSNNNNELKTTENLLVTFSEHSCDSQSLKERFETEEEGISTHHARTVSQQPLIMQTTNDNNNKQKQQNTSKIQSNKELSNVKAQEPSDKVVFFKHNQSEKSVNGQTQKITLAKESNKIVLKKNNEKLVSLPNNFQTNSTDHHRKHQIEKKKTRFFNSKSGKGQGNVDYKKEEENEQKQAEIIQEKAAKCIKKAKIMNIMEKVKKQFNNVLENTEIRRLQFLRPQHYKMIGDQSIDLSEMEVKQKENLMGIFQLRIQNMIRSCNELLKTIVLMGVKKTWSPNSYLNQIMAWVEVGNIVQMITLFSFYIFYNFDDRRYIENCLILSLIATIIGSVIRLNSAYYEHGKLVTNPNKRLRRYLNLYFKPDLVGFLTIIYCLLDQDSKHSKILALPIFYRIKTLVNLVEEQQKIRNFSGSMFYVKGLIILFCQIIAVCHFIGIAYHMLAIWENDYLGIQDNWLKKNGLWDADWDVRYMESFYWSLATIMLVGSKGETLLETIFCCLTLLTTVGMFATILTKITQLIEEMDSQSKLYREQVGVLTKMFNNNTHISQKTQMQILNYLKYLNQGHEDMQNSHDVQNIIEKFPQDMRNHLKQEKYKNHLDRIKFIKNFSSETITNIFTIVKEEYFMPNQVIWSAEKDNSSDKKLYLVMKGKVSIQAVLKSQDRKKKDKIVECQMLDVGQNFGQFAFFTDITENIQYVSKEFTTVLTISQTEFLDILERNTTRHDIELFYKFRHQLITTGGCDQIPEMCFKCGKYSHKSDHCNIVNFTPNFQFLLGRYKKSEDQKRSKEVKRYDTKIWALGNQQIVSQQRKEILQSTEMRSYLKELQNQLKESEDKIDLMFSYKKQIDQINKLDHREGQTPEKFQEIRQIDEENYEQTEGQNVSIVNEVSEDDQSYTSYSESSSDSTEQDDDTNRKFLSVHQDFGSDENIQMEQSLTRNNIDIQEIKINVPSEIKYRSSKSMGIAATTNEQQVSKKLDGIFGVEEITATNNNQSINPFVANGSQRNSQKMLTISNQNDINRISFFLHDDINYEVSSKIKVLKVQNSIFLKHIRKVMKQEDFIRAHYEDQKSQVFLEFDKKAEFTYFFPENNFERLFDKCLEYQKKVYHQKKYGDKWKNKTINQRQSMYTSTYMGRSNSHNSMKKNKMRYSYVESPQKKQQQQQQQQ